jgi:hypothetical protein
MDYKLKLAYEQMLNGNVKPSTPKQNNPKNLTEAYTTVLHERVAIYAKPIGQETIVAPTQPGLKSLGVADNEESIQQAIKSYTIAPAIEKLLQSAGNWSNVDNYVDTLRTPLSLFLAKTDLSGDDINNIVLHKQSLTRFSEAVASEQPFNALEVISGDLKSLLKKEETPELDKHITKFFNYIFAQKAKIGDVGVGLGEIAFTALTDCTKGKIGDLYSPSIGSIELKASGGRLAPKTQVNSNFITDLINFVQEQKTQPRLGKSLYNLVNTVRNRFEEIQDHEDFNKIFSNTFVSYINNLIDSLGSSRFDQKYQQSVFNLPLKLNSTFDKYKALKFLNSSNSLAIGDSNTIKNIEQANANFDKEYIFEVHTNIKNLFRELVYKTRTINSSKVKEIDYAISQKANKITDVLSKTKTLLGVLKEVYFTDLGLTVDQKANALLLIVNPSYRSVAEKFLPEIKTFFERHEKDFAMGDEEIIHKMVFALQTVIYANNHFNFLCVVSRTNKMCMGMKANSFLHLTEKFQEANEAIRLSVAVRIDADRGGSAVIFSGEKEIQED